MFIATSLDHGTATNFALNIASPDPIPGVCGPRKRVLFEVRFDAQRCMHANYIGKGETEVPGEAELLLPPYSGFEVVSVPNFDEPKPDDEFYTIVLKAMHDNKGLVGEDVPVARWH